MFQRTFTEATVKRTLQLNSTETKWMWMHSGERGVEFPSPTSSEYHLPMTKRPKSAGVSHLTARENQRLHNNISFYIPQSPKKPTFLPDSSPPKTPTDHDFQRVIARLSKLQSVTYGRRITLVEDKTEVCVLENMEMQYFKVPLMDKAVPLNVMLKRTKGRAVIYMSKSVSEPSDLVNDGVYRKDMFTITELGSKFRIESIFFAMQAVGTLAVSVTIRFGKRRNIRSDWSPRGRLTQTEEEEKWENYQRKQEAKITSPAKSFVRLNLVVVPNSSPKRILEAQKKQKLAETRRKSAIIRRKSIEAEKKKRAFLQLHRQEVKQKECELVLEAEAQKRRKFNCQMDWLRLISNSHFLENLIFLTFSRKENLLLQAKQHKSAVKIQARFKAFVKGANVSEIALRHARRSFYLYYRQISYPIIKQHRAKLVAALRKSKENAVVVEAVWRLVKRGNR